MNKLESKTFSFDPLGYYAILGVDYHAGDAEIKQNYRDRAKILHPDHNTDENALENFQELSVAYDVLKEDSSRLIYDLMAQTHPREKFPNINALKAYKNQHDKEDVFVRTINIRQVLGKLWKFSDSSHQEICNFKEAKLALFLASILNWTLGWWNPKSFVLNLRAIIGNIKNLNTNTQENFTLLTHNAVAYWQDNKKEAALLSALQAGLYADSYRKGLLNKFIALLNVGSNKRAPLWNYTALKTVQLIVPGIVALGILLSLGTTVISEADLSRRFSKNNEITYYQKVNFRTGGQTVDDLVVAKIIDLPADSENLTMLYHTLRPVKVMHGPSDDFDVMAEIKSRQTVRMTGYTPDQAWYRVQLDNGNMGFVRAENLKKGVGLSIPDGSKVYTGNAFK